MENEIDLHFLEVELLIGWEFGQVISVSRITEALCPASSSEMRRDIGLGRKGLCLTPFEVVHPSL